MMYAPMILDIRLCKRYIISFYLGFIFVLMYNYDCVSPSISKLGFIYCLSSTDTHYNSANSYNVSSLIFMQIVKAHDCIRLEVTFDKPEEMSCPKHASL